jgi:hypothetical protein
MIGARQKTNAEDGEKQQSQQTPMPKPMLEKRQAFFYWLRCVIH